MLVFLLTVYTTGLLNALIILAGGQELNPEIWRLESLPAYSIVFALGGARVLATLRWKKLGLQGMLGLTFQSILIVVAVFLGLLTALNRKYFFTVL